MGDKDLQKLQDAVSREAGRAQRAEQERSSLIAQTAYLGSLAMMFVIPVVGAAYLGRWLDSLAGGYSVRWTVSLIVLAVGVGAFNVYWFIRNRP